MSAVGIFAPFISKRFLKKGGEKRFILTAIILSILVLLLIIFVRELIFAFLIIILQSIFDGMSWPVERTYFQKFIKSKIRATVGSVERMLFGFSALVAMPLVGLSVELFGARYTLFLSGVLMIPSVLLFLKIKEKP